MVKGVSFDPAAVYDDTAVQLALGVSAEALARARRNRELRFTRKARRVLYLGAWILTWLDSDAAVRQGVHDDH